MIFFGLVFMWIGYPTLVMFIRSQFYNLNPKYVSGQFIYYSFVIGIYYSFVIGFCVTTSGIIFSSIIYGLNVVAVSISILLGFISETVILFPDKLEQRFRIELKSFSVMRKYIIALILSYVAILIIIKFILIN